MDVRAGGSLRSAMARRNVFDPLEPTRDLAIPDSRGQRHWGISEMSVPRGALISSHAPLGTGQYTDQANATDYPSGEASTHVPYCYWDHSGPADHGDALI